MDDQRRANGTSGDPIGNMQDRVRRTNDSKREGKTDPPTAYIYHNADGSPRLRVNRTQNRNPPFWQEHWDGSRWVKGGGDQPRVPYRLLELLAAEHDTVLIVEGEKDADNVAALGFVATCNAGGSGNWHPDLNQHFKGKDIFILPDNDEAGEKHARTVHDNLKGIAREIKILRLPDIAYSQDVSDWIAAGGTQDGLADLLRAAPQYEEAAPEIEAAEPRASVLPARELKSLPFKTLADLAAEETVQKQWVIKGVLARGETSAWVGPPGSMKSSLLCSAAIHASSPQVTDWYGYRCKERTASLYFALERADLVKRRLIAECKTLGIDFPPIAIIQKQFTLSRPGEHRLLADTIKAAEDRFGMSVGLAIFDTLAKLIAAGGGDENSARDCNVVFANIAELKDETNAHVAFAAHTGKDVSRGNARFQRTAWRLRHGDYHLRRHRSDRDRIQTE